VKVCPHCAEELPDEATVCPNCHKDPALAPAWNVPRPDETSRRRLGDVFGPDGVLPTSDQVPSPVERLESPGTYMGSFPRRWTVHRTSPTSSGVCSRTSTSRTRVR
jgi:zinc-ribbon domain